LRIKSLAGHVRRYDNRDRNPVCSTALQWHCL